MSDLKAPKKSWPKSEMGYVWFGEQIQGGFTVRKMCFLWKL